MPSILFVCTGNTCRSVMAEMCLRHALPPGSPWVVRSAGTAAFDGSPPSGHAQTVLNEAGIPFDPRKTSNILSAALVRDAALVIPLAQAHAQAALFKGGSASRVRLLSSFAPGPRPPDIEDPCGLDVAAYRACLAEIRACIPGVAAFLAALGRPQ